MIKVYDVGTETLAKHVVAVAEYWGYPISYEKTQKGYMILADEPESETESVGAWVGGVVEGYCFMNGVKHPFC